MADWVEALAKHLEDNSLGTRGSSIFIGTLPDTATVVSVLTPYGGRFVETNSSGIAIKIPQLQVRVRGAVEDYTTPSTQINAIYDLLSLISNTTVNTVKFLRVKPTGTISAMGRDENKRHEFTANFEVSLG